MGKRILLMGFIGMLWSVSACTEEVLNDIIENLHHGSHGDADTDTDVDTAVDTEYCEKCYYDEDGAVVCEAVPCDGGCYVYGSYYLPGESFEASDGCNTCICEEDGMVSCTVMACAEGCYVDGELYLVGEEFGDECSFCVCEAPGELICYDIDGCERDSGCDDGTIPMCDMIEPDCNEPFEILAFQDDCYRCVNPATCHAWGVADCETDSDCSLGAVCDQCGTSSCPDCDDCVAACVSIDLI